MVAVGVHFKNCGVAAMEDLPHRASKSVCGFKILPARGDVHEDKENVADRELAVVVGVAWHPAQFCAVGLPSAGGRPCSVYQLGIRQFDCGDIKLVREKAPLPTRCPHEHRYRTCHGRLVPRKGH